MKFLTILFLWLLFFLSSSAQEPDYTFYNVEDGLPSNEIYDIFEDSKGYIWFATDNGVSKYDGEAFNNLSKKEGLPDDVIFFFHEDLKHRIWLISYSGLLSYYHDNQVCKYAYNDTIQKYLKNVSLINNASFYVDSLDNVSFGTTTQGIFEISNQGCLKLHNSKNRVQIQNNEDYTIVGSNRKYTDARARINNKHTIKNRKVSVGRGRLKVYVLENESLLFGNGDKLFEIYGDSVLKKEISVRGPYTNYSLDRDSNMWISYYGQGIEIFNKRTREKKYHLFKNRTINTYLKDSHSGSWFGTNSGVYYSENIDINLIEIGGDKYKEVKNISLGKNGCVFFSTYNSNIYSYENDSLRSYKSSHKGLILSLNYDNFKEELIAGSVNGHEYLNSKGERTKPLQYYYSNLEKLSQNYHFNKAVIPFNDSLLWRLHDQVTYFNRNTSVVKRIDTGRVINNAKLMSIYYKDSLLYIGSKEGLWTYNFTSIKPCLNKNEVLKTKIVDITSDLYDNLYLGTKGNGVLILTEDSIYQINEKTGLSSNQVKTIYVKDHIIWAGTINGLNIIEMKSFNPIRFNIRKIYNYHGLPSNVINDVVQYKEQVYVATDNGLSYFNPSKLYFNKKPLALFFTKILISEKDTILKSHYNLSYEQNNIHFSFQALNYKKNYNIVYKYRLKGLENKWHETYQNSIRYPFLMPGRYLFEIKSKNENGIWNENPKTISFDIEKPYWQTWWFYGLLFIVPLTVIALILVIIYNIKIKESDKRLVLYENVVVLRQKALAQQMNPHFIFNTLSSIQYYINENDKKASNKYLTMFARLMRLTLNNSYEKSIPISEELEALEIYIKLEQLRFSDRFFYEINISSNINPQDYLMPSLLLQPFVENSIWHGIMHRPHKNGNIMISLEKFKEEIMFTVVDNGIGRKRSAEINLKSNKTHQSLGAKITETRLKLINTSKSDKLVVNYSDLYDEKGGSSGTKVRIRLPLVKNNIPKSN